MTKEQFKEFVKTHKKEILIAVGGIAVGSLCGVGVYKYANKDYEDAVKWLIKLNCLDAFKSGGVFSYIPTPDAFTMGDIEDAISDLVCEVNDNSIELTGVLVFTKETLKHLGLQKKD